MTTPGRHLTPITGGSPQQRRESHDLEPLPPGSKAGLRAPARERDATQVQQQPQLDSQPQQVTDGEGRTSLGARFARWITPPNPSTIAPPTWDELRWQGDHGRHAPASGWPRTFSVAWSRTVALPGRALAVWLDWVAGSPSRFLVVFVLYALLVHVPGLGWLPWIY